MLKALASIVISFCALISIARGETLGTQSTGGVHSSATTNSGKSAGGKMDYCGKTAVEAYSKNARTKNLIEITHQNITVSPEFFDHHHRGNATPASKGDDEGQDVKMDDQRSQAEIRADRAKAAQGSTSEADLRQKYKKDGNRSVNLSFMYLKYALMGAGFTDKKLEGGMAKNAGPELEKIGFFNLMKCSDWASKIKKPSDVPPGTIVVLSPKKNSSGKPYGTIALKSKYGCDSDFASSDCNFGDRTVLGVYFKPEM
jgi:hypothetical protein